MRKRLVAVFLLFILLFSTVHADDFQQDPDLSKAMPVIVDVVTVAMVANYGETKVYLPSMGISSSESGLPTRISFFLTDPAAFTKSIAKALGLDNKDLISAIISSFNSTISDPVLSAVYYSLLSKNYKVGNYLISGNLLLTFPEDVSHMTLEELMSADLSNSDPILIQSNLNVYGSELSKPVSITGVFSLDVEEKTHVVLRPVNEYMINNNLVTGGEFRF